MTQVPMLTVVLLVCQVKHYPRHVQFTVDMIGLQDVVNGCELIIRM